MIASSGVVAIGPVASGIGSVKRSGFTGRTILNKCLARRNFIEEAARNSQPKECNPDHGLGLFETVAGRFPIQEIGWRLVQSSGAFSEEVRNILLR